MIQTRFLRRIIRFNIATILHTKVVTIHPQRVGNLLHVKKITRFNAIHVSHTYYWIPKNVASIVIWIFKIKIPVQHDVDKTETHTPSTTPSTTKNKSGNRKVRSTSIEKPRSYFKCQSRE